MNGLDVSHITHLPLHTPGIYMRYVRAVDDTSSSEVSSSSSSVVRLNDPTLLVWNVSIDRSGASVLRLRSPVTIQNTSNIAMEVLTITDDSACTWCSSVEFEREARDFQEFFLQYFCHVTQITRTSLAILTHTVQENYLKINARMYTRLYDVNSNTDT